MNKELQKQCEEAAKADQEKALAIVAAMDKCYIEMYGEPPEEE